MILFGGSAFLLDAGGGMVSPSRKSRIKIAIKMILTVLVLAFVARHVVGTWRDLQSKGQSVRIDAGWFAASVVLYLLGLAAFGFYFWKVMKSSATPTRFYPALRAYMISHLGKYVPGKALVVVMRAGLVSPYGARPATAAFATLYETLVMMASGSLLAGICFAATSKTEKPVALTIAGDCRLDVPVAWGSLALASAFLVVVWPSVFARLAALTRLPMPNVGPDALPRFTPGLLAEGLTIAAVGWVLLGLSQVAVIRAVSSVDLSGNDVILVIASVALATVAGFVVPIAPGGLGVREWVLWTALASTIDHDLAVVAALVLRLSWVVGEILAGGILFAIRPASTGPVSP